jgi:hypothetical protein
MSEAPLPEPLESFLEHPPGLPQDGDVRESILRMTSNRLPSTRWPHWPIALIGVAAMMAFVMLAGSYFLLRLGRVAPPAIPDIVENKVVTPRPPKQPPPPEVIQVKAPPHPRELEWKAFDAAEDRARVRLYFQAGDLYLDRFDDVQSALRCYQQAIHFSGAEELEINPRDNWLVMALKRDHRKEK